MLESYRQLFRELERRGIRYAIWKSLELWEAQIAGVGDIDVIFDPDQESAVADTLCDMCFVEDLESPDRIGERIKVYRGFDCASLKHETIHAHFGCWFGSKRYKEFTFPNTQELFDKAFRVSGVFRISQGHFIVTRILIVALRRTYQDSYVCELARGYEELSDANRGIVDTHLGHFFGISVRELMGRIGEGEITALEEVRGRALEQMEKECPFFNIQKKVKAENIPKSFWKNRFVGILGGKRNKLGAPIAIMFAGHDGAGKSTAARNLQKAVSKVAMTKCMYLGRRSWKWPNSWINLQRQKEGLSRTLNLIWPFCSTLEIICRVFMGRFLVKMGFIVIYDRSIYDLQIKWRRSPRKIGSWFPLWISRRWAGRPEADLCYLLVADPQAVKKRQFDASESSEMIADLAEKYKKELGDWFVTIDTTEIPEDDLVRRVMSDIFKFAAKV